MKKKFLFFTLFILPFTAFAQQPVTVLVSAGKYPRYQTPVVVKLPNPVSTNKPYQLQNQQTGRLVHAQLLDSVTLVFVMEDSMKAGATHAYLLKTSTALVRRNTVKVKKTDEGLLVTSNDKPVFFYHTREVMPPPDSPLYYKRSGFIHPLYSPDGKVLTDDFPSSHAHQHGIFMTWVNTTFKKEFVDFWNQHLQKGTVEHAEVLSIRQGTVCAQLQLQLRHKSLKHGEVLNEKWTITVYPFSSYFLFDMESEQVNTTSDTLFLNKYHYGGLAFRGTRNWDPFNKKYFQNNWNIITSEGIKDSAANHTKARWVDASGAVDDIVSGATVFNHPSNFRYPQSIRVHPNMPYWAFAPVVDSAFYLAPGIPYHSRFRYYVHRGAPVKDMIEKLFTDFTEPVEVRVMK
jgi:hypothetical protein